jgi:hypothetical protein
MSPLTDIETFTVEHCCNCGIAFAMTTDYHRRRVQDRRDFYCPAGHPQHYTGQNDAERIAELQRQIASRAEDLRAEQLSHRATRGQLTKAKKAVQRAERGVCLHCHRSFVNVARHVQTQHPQVLGGEA